MSTEDLITTTEASTLTGRGAGAVRMAIRRGHLTMIRRTELGRPLLERQAVLDWHENSAVRPPSLTARAWERTAAMLLQYGPASASELAELLQLDVGTVRKHLAILATQGAAERQPNGHWVTVADAASGAA